MRPSLTLLTLPVLAAACASAGTRASDPWLRGKVSSDCQQPACLFAVVRDSAGTPLSGADVEISGTNIRVTTSNNGRLALQGVPLGSHRLRLYANGMPVESGPLSFGMTILAVMIEVRGDSVLVHP